MQTFSELESEKQQKFYSEILKLKESGLGYKKIIKKFKKDHDVKLSLGTLSYWFNNDVQNIGGENCFIPKASPELSYVLGVMFGDGSLSYNRKKQEYSLALKAIDKDFVEKFAACGSKILRKDKYYSVCYVKSRRLNEKPIYATKIHGKKLYNFVTEIKEDFEKGKEFIEPYPAEFIQGLADSEGTCSVSILSGFSLSVCIACSTNVELLRYVKNLIEMNFSIRCRLKKTKSVGQTDSIIDGRTVKRTKDLFALFPSGEVESIIFVMLVGFSILRKIQRFEDYLYLLKNFGKDNARNLWTKIYHKKGRYWIRNNKIPINKLIFID